MAPARRVALRREQHVLAHRVQLPLAERAAVRGRLQVLRTPNGPPVGLAEIAGDRVVD
jgi:hypothetical protein